MSKGKAFFSTLPGVVSGIAAALTAVVGLLTVSVQLGWIGGDDGDNGGSTTTTVTSGAAGVGPGGGGAGGGSASPAGLLTVTPTRLTFAALGSKEATVTVRNDGSGPVTLRPPTFAGPDRGQFSASSSCPATLEVSGSCTVRVTFSPGRGGRYEATMVVAPAAGGVRAVEVPIEGNHLL